MKCDKVHVVLASDANYLPGLEVTRASILRSCSTPERLVWHVFDETDLAKLNLDAMPRWNTSRMAYLRLWLPKLLNDVDWVIYSDVDIIWNRDLCELWDGVINVATSAVDTKLIYWVRDFQSMRSASGVWIDRVATAEGVCFDWAKYACSGIVVMNLKKMREIGFTQRVSELFAKYGVPKYPDQDVLNVICNGDCDLLPSVWCAMGDPNNLPPSGERCVYHITGIGRHFHDPAPTTYPPQYQFWWNMRLGAWAVSTRSRWLAALWPLRFLVRLLPLRPCERIFRQLFFAKILRIPSTITFR